MNAAEMEARKAMAEGRPVAMFVVARSGRVHDHHCLSLTHDGPCDCPFVLAVHEPRRRPKVI